MQEIVLVIIGSLLILFVICVLATISTYRLEQTNKQLQSKINDLTAENIELKKNFEECKQTIKTLQKISNVSNKTLSLHTLKPGYLSKLIDEHFNELI